MISDDLEYSEANVGSAQAQGVRKNISLKLKGKGRGRGRRTTKARRVSTKKSVPDVGEEDDENEAPETPTDKPPATVTPVVAETKIEEVLSITKLETPSFNPLDRTIPEPLHQNKTLRWDHKVNLIGEKVIDPLIHCCEKCALPILNYGRLIACKHVFCYDCAKKADKCPKCDEKITRVEQSTLGTVFMCNYGGTRHVPGTCGRTYLSQRDLQAHINHRHTKPASGGNTSAAPSSRDPRDPRAHTEGAQQPLLVGTHLHDDNRNPLGSPPVGQRTAYPHSPASGYQTSIPVSSARPNLITVPIQDDSSSAANPPASGVPPPHIHAPVHPVQYTSCTTPPLQMPPNSSYQGGAYPPQHPPTYSQAQFSQPPPPVVHPPQMPPNAPPIYSAPPPVVHHAPPPTSYTPARPPATYTPPRPPPRPPMPPQAHFPPPSGGTYEDPPPRGYMQQWNSGVPPPPNRTAIQPRPISQPPPSGGPQGHMPPRGATDPGYRPPYYQ